MDLGRTEPPAKSTGPELAPGDMVDHFQIMRSLGQGGMGDVYLARDTKLGRKVALKVVRPGSLGSSEAKERFLREARTTARFSHPHIVTIFAVGEQAGRPYVALEYLEGETLRQRFYQERPALKEALRIGLATAEALGEAHRHNILHRDLKPENIILARDGRLRVLDFGLAKTFGDEVSDTAPDLGLRLAAASATGQQMFESAPGHVAGTPAYMAPEQWTGEPTSGATDVWALGTILFELLVGHTPYREANVARLALQVVQPDPVPAIDVAVPTGVAELIRRCLSKEPARRPGAAAVAADLRKLLGDDRPELGDEESPFPGLATFGRQHAGVFFGREVEIGAILERLRDEPVLPLVGPSGAGKSSLVQAGLIPRLAERGRLIVLSLRPGTNPLRLLASRLLNPSLISAVDSRRAGAMEGLPSGSTRQSSAAEEARLAQELAEAPRQMSLRLRELAARERATVLLFVDQLEELYTLVQDEEVQLAFMRCICGAADDAYDPVRVVFALRDDFLGRLVGGPEVREALDHVTVLPPPGPEAMADMLTRPLEVTGYRYDDLELVPEMIAAVRGEVSCLPLLQFACRTLWDRRDQESRLLLRSVYDDMGGVVGALAGQADAVIDALPAVEARLARKMLLRLVTTDGTRKVLVRSQVLEGLDAAATPALDRLIQARLLAQRRGPSEEGQEAQIELAHGSLVKSWRRLARWIEESREERIFLDGLNEAAELWHRRGRRQDEVWKGDELREARRTVERQAPEIPERVAQFLDAGQVAARRRLWRKRGGVAISFAVLGALALVFFVQEREAHRRREQAVEQRRLAEQHRAQAQVEGARAAYQRGDLVEAGAKLRGAIETLDTSLGRALWWQLRRDPRKWRRELGSLVHDVAFSPDGLTVAAACQNRTIHLYDKRTLAGRVLRAHGDQVVALAFSPDGRRLASASLAGEVRLWDLEQRTVRQLHGHRAAVWDLDFSPDGRLLATASWDRTIHLWDLAGGGRSRTLSGHSGFVYAARFSPDGRRLVSGGADNTVRLWDTASGDSQRVLLGHTAEVRTVAFRPDGRQVASAGRDQTVRLWDASTGVLQVVLGGHTAAIHRVRYAPDGRQLASGGADGTILIWEPGPRPSPRTLARLGGAVKALAYSPDGAELVSAGADKTVRLWRVARPAGGAPAAESSGAVSGGALWGVAFSPDDKQVAASGRDGEVRLLDVASGRLRRILTGPPAQITAVTFSPDGRLLAAGGDDQTVRLWEAASGRPHRALLGHTATVLGVAFSPDGRWLASASSDRTVRLWDAAAGSVLRTLAGHTAAVWDVAFSPDGQLVASAGRDATVRLWSARTGRLVRTLAGHERGGYGVSFSPDGRLLASSSEDGSLRVWNVRTGRGRIIARQSGRLYYAAFHPDGRHVGAASSDGRAYIWDLEGQAIRLEGHRAEVNTLRFSRDGRLAATSSDDGTVRLWLASSGRPFWRTAGLLGTPPRLFSHEGWRALDGARPADPSPAGWGKAVERARLLSVDRASRRLCLVDHHNVVELWDQAADRRLFQDQLPAARQVLALADGCLVLAGDQARLYSADGRPRELGGGVRAVARDKDSILVAAGATVLVFDGQGRQRASCQTDVGVTALARAGDRLVLGFDDGSIESRDFNRGAALPLESVPASAVVRLIDGPMGTVIAGFANGTLGIWNLGDGMQLARVALHGPVASLLLEGGKLYAATDLGDHSVLDLNVFARGRCELMREIWRTVPVLWEGGQPVLRQAPRGHRCSSGESR